MQELWMPVFVCWCLFVCMFAELKNYFWGGLESISECWNVCWFLMSEQKSESTPKKHKAALYTVIPFQRSEI